jgi:protein TonB
MLPLKTLVPRFSRRLRAAPGSGRSPEPQQRRMMLVALILLLGALGLELYGDRDFWFPDRPGSEGRTQSDSPASAGTLTTRAAAARRAAPAHKKSHRNQLQPEPAAPSDVAPSDPSDPSAPPGASITRTVLPPLEVEVVAGNVHRTIHPGTNSVHVDLQPDPSQPDSSQPIAPAQEVSEVQPAGDQTDTAATATTNAAERVQMSADTADVVNRPVKPGYPLLARQMKVQGSVILQALIGRDGLIQDLRVLSGPPILATAAEEAVRQWHFKPHFQGATPVETQAKITVNFTISTN